jgi:hypothetical protein
VEIYDLQPLNGELGNLSVRGDVQTADNVLIDGVILGPGNPRRVLFRATGPSIQGQVPGALSDPTLEVHDNNGNILGTNDNWRDALNATEIANTGLAPTSDAESAILMTLPAANYTSIVRSANGATGIAVSEAFKLNN